MGSILTIQETISFSRKTDLHRADQNMQADQKVADKWLSAQ